MNSFDWREDELYHHGIFGMKWGVRRFQNDDGSLTPAGRRHYGIEEGKKLTKTRKQDVDVYGRKGADRIQKRIHVKGMSRKKAERREFFRGAVTDFAKISAASLVYDEVLNNGLARKTTMAVVKQFIMSSARSAAKAKAMRESIMKLPMKAINAYVADIEDYKIR